MLRVMKFTDKFFSFLHMAGDCSSVRHLLTRVLYSRNVWRVLGWLRKRDRHKSEEGGEQVNTCGEGERASAPSPLTKLGQLTGFKAKQEKTMAKSNRFGVGVFFLKHKQL